MPFTLRSTLLSCALLLTTPAMASTSHAQTLETTFAVPAGSLENVLLGLSQQSGQAISADPQLLEDLRSPAIQGSFSLEQAVGRALSGSGLELRSNASGITIVRHVAQTPRQADPRLDAVVVTGNRGSELRTVASSPSPIDVITSEKLRESGATSMRDALKRLIPSLNVQHAASNSHESVSRPATLRGLSPSHTLVLVNGKRRHASAMINASRESTLANSVDLDLIPLSAIERVEVLRDGASAQYGSDAIAGVINIVLKQQDHGGQAISKVGQRASGDGQQLYQSLNSGFSLPADGVFNLSLDARSNQSASIAERASGAFYGIDGVNSDPRDETVGRHVFGGGLPKIKQVNVAYNAELPIDDDLTFYSFSTISQRDGWIGANFRRPNATSNGSSNSANNVIELRPDGFTPYYRAKQLDYQLAAGFKGGSEEGWQWDASSTYSRDKLRHEQESLNVSLGPDSPTRFHLYDSRFDQWSNNLDFNRAFDVGLAKPLQFAYGFEHRYEHYRTEAGDPAGWAVGNYQIRGVPGVAGVQAATTVSDQQTADIDRDSFAGYLDLGLNPTEQLYIGLAARYESYRDDADDSFSGKLSSRYEFAPQLAVRATLSNGFRAPSLSQTAHQQSSSANYTINAQTVLVTSSNIAVDSGLARALGAEGLKPEKSTNFSIGLVWQPTPATNLSIDAYQIRIRDRLVLTGFIRDSGNGSYESLLANYGYAPNTWVRFATNGLDTTTSGLDLVFDHSRNLGSAGDLKLGLALNLNTTRIDDVKESPAALVGSGNVLLDRTARSYFTSVYPKNKLILSADYNLGAFSLRAALTRYGKHTDVSSESHYYDVEYPAQWITDLELGWRFNEQLSVALGAQNLFDIDPPSKGYDLTSNPAGFPSTGSNPAYDPYGAYYYGSLTYNF